jgi:hypothetical protein
MRVRHSDCFALFRHFPRSMSLQIGMRLRIRVDIVLRTTLTEQCLGHNTALG